MEAIYQNNDRLLVQQATSLFFWLSLHCSKTNQTQSDRATQREVEGEGAQRPSEPVSCFVGFPAAIETTNCVSVPIGVLVLGSVVEDLKNSCLNDALL